MPDRLGSDGSGWTRASKRRPTYIDPHSFQEDGLRNGGIVSEARGARVTGVVGTFLLSLPLIAVGVGEATAQVPGNIDWPAATGGDGVAVAVDATQGLNLGSGESLYLGARVLMGMPRAAVWVGGGYGGLAGAGDNVGGGGAGFALQLAESGVTSLSLEAGVGFGRQFGSWIWGVPAGLTLWLIPEASRAKPFVRAHAVAAGGGGSGTEVGGSGMAGVEVVLPNGMGLHLALQFEKLGFEEALVIGGGVAFGR
jgi:hypothetical protein